MIGLRQESESKGVIVMIFAAAAVTGGLSVYLLDSLMWNGGEQACVDSAIDAGCGFLRNVLRTVMFLPRCLLHICLL